jgi:hypothetical protein
LDGSNLGAQLSYLFQILNTPTEDRPRNLDEEISTLPYVNGGLFADPLPIPTFDVHGRNDLLACFNFDWSRVSPAIFGSMFEAVMSNEAAIRHSLGMHYTSETNILKVLNGLFLEELHTEFSGIRNDLRRLMALKDRLASLKLFDPACGCGNFLVVAYRELRRLEIEILKRIVELQPQTISDVTILCRVDVDQVTGIEIAENPAAIAEVALWITDHQMNQELSDTFGRSLTRLPLRKSARILRANALRTDWRDLFETEDMVTGRVFIFGNPPFVAKANRTDEQNGDHDYVWGELRGHGILDYVTCWLARASEFLDGTRTQAAFVSTSSVTQGEQVGVLWPALRRRGTRIFFAHRTFRWTSESRDQAAVFCVVLGLTSHEVTNKRIFDYETPDSIPHELRVSRINPYLIEEDEALVVTSRSVPLCDVPEIRFGSMPNDGGNLLLSQDQLDVFLREEPGARPYVRQLVGSEEFINGGMRYCLWLKDAEPRELRRMPRVLARLDAVARHRRTSRRPQTQELAAVPALFGEDRQPTTPYILIPSVSSERRHYIPMAIMDASIIASNLCLTVETSDLYTLGTLSSMMHMAWIRTVAGRLEGRFRYSNQIVYNNFPWPLNANDTQRQRVRDAMADVINARTSHPGSTLSDLYDPRTMPDGLADAHRALDRAVDRCYRQAPFDAEFERFQYLIRAYGNLMAPLTSRPRRQHRIGR